MNATLMQKRNISVTSISLTNVGIQSLWWKWTRIVLFETVGSLDYARVSLVGISGSGGLGFAFV